MGSGDVVALIGGNARTATLMKIIMGIYQPDGGELLAVGSNAEQPHHGYGRAFIWCRKNPLLFPNMTVEENIVVRFSEKPAVLRLVELMEENGWELDLGRKASDLSIARTARSLNCCAASCAARRC